MGLFGSQPPPNPYTRVDMQRDISPSRINSEVYSGQYPPLSCAMSHGNAAIVRELIRNGADMYYSGSLLISIPDQLCHNDNLELIKVFINEGYDVNYSGMAGGRTLLHSYAETDSIEIIKFLIKSGANVNAEDSFGGTPVQEAASRGYIKVLKFLIDSGGNVNVTRLGVTPLFEAILGNSVSISAALGTGKPRIDKIKILINAGADVNAVCIEESILDVAYESENEEVIKILIDAGASKRS